MKKKLPILKGKYPKFKAGGAILGNIQNFAVAGLDSPMSVLGMGNTMDKYYSKDPGAQKSAEILDKTTDFGGKIAPAVAGVVGTIYGGPAGGAAAMQGMKGIQKMGGSMDTYDPNNPLSQDNKASQAGSMLNNVGMQGVSTYGQVSGSMANGGMHQGAPNAEVEKQENSVAPNGEFTQYNGPSHEAGGIPTKLDIGEMVFSDRLKMNGKTFASLNKTNDTNKEDKILGDNKADRLKKLSAQLMKEAKVKQSMKLFEAQESLKQSKMESYAKRIGMSADKFSGGGMYGPGDPRKVDAIPQGYVKGSVENGKQIYTKTNTTQPNYNVNPGTAKTTDPDGYVNELIGKLKSGEITPEEIQGRKLVSPDVLERIRGNYTQDKVYMDIGKQTPIPNEFTPNQQDMSAFRLQPKRDASQKYNTWTVPNNDGQTNKSTDIYTDNEGYEIDLMHDFKRTGKTLNDYRQTATKLDSGGSTMLPQGYDKINPVQVNYNGNKSGTTGQRDMYRYGGLKKFGNGDVYYGPGLPQADNMPMYKYSTPEPTELKGPQGLQGDPYGSGVPGAQVSNPEGGPNWGNIAMQVGNGLMQNAGNLYDLKRGRKADVENYDRAHASLLDPTADLDYNRRVYKGTVKDIGNASVGNSSTYLNNRTKAASDQMLNNSRISTQYGNMNAQIKNQNSQFNTNISMQEKIANSQNQAQARNLTGNALNNIGQNAYKQSTGVQKDNKLESRDSEILSIIAKKYPQFMNDPAMVEYMKKYGGNK